MHHHGEGLTGKFEETQEGREILDGSDEGDVGDASVGQFPSPRAGQKATRGNRRDGAQRNCGGALVEGTGGTRVDHSTV